MKGELLLELYNVRPADPGIAPLWLREPRRRERLRCAICGREGGPRDPATARMILQRRKRIPEELPDMLGHHIVRANVVKQMEDAGITGYRAYPMPWETEGEGGRVIPATKEAISKLPTYCFLEVLGGVEIDLFELDHGRGSVCHGCGLRTFRASEFAHPPERYVPVPGTWDGSDWCEWRNLVNASPLCSRKVIDLAARLRWTNFLFGESLPGVSSYSPVPEDWFPNVAARVRQLYPDLFVR